MAGIRAAACVIQELRVRTHGEILLRTSARQRTQLRLPLLLRQCSYSDYEQHQHYHLHLPACLAHQAACHLADSLPTNHIESQDVPTHPLTHLRAERFYPLLILFHGDVRFHAVPFSIHRVNNLLSDLLLHH